MSERYNSKNKSQNKELKAVLYFAIFLIALGLGNIIFGASRSQEFTKVLNKLETIKKIEEINVSEPFDQNLVVNKVDSEKLDSGIKRAKAKLDFYRFVSLGGKCLLGISALLILYCLYYSKDFEKKPVLILFIALVSFSCLT